MDSTNAREVFTFHLRLASEVFFFFCFIANIRSWRRRQTLRGLLFCASPFSFSFRSHPRVAKGYPSEKPITYRYYHSRCTVHRRCVFFYVAPQVQLVIPSFDQSLKRTRLTVSARCAVVINDFLCVRYV